MIAPAPSEIVLPPLTAEEKLYERRLIEGAALALGPDWEACWPLHLKQTRPIAYISDFGPFGSLEKLILRTKERTAETYGACMIENIPFPWAVRLGAAWDMDPQFFISHARPLTKAEIFQSLHEGRVPNSKGGLASSRHENWATVRGFIDWGKPQRVLDDTDLKDSTHRQHAVSVFDTRQSHTNFSFYRVNEFLHIILVDQIPDYQHEFVLPQLLWFPHQTIIRLALLDSPGHITIPQLGSNKETAVFPIWALFNDRTHMELLLNCLKDDDVDEFIYRACLYWTEREVTQVSLDIEMINEQQATGDGRTITKSLPNLQKAATRLKSCIIENRGHEDRLLRAASLKDSRYPAWEDFRKLAIRFTEIDTALMQCFYRQMMLLTATGTEDNLKQTLATKKQADASLYQAESMSTLSWLAFVYIPLTFVTGIFGMNVKEMDTSCPLSWKLAAGIAIAFLSVTFIIARTYRSYQKSKAPSSFGGSRRHWRVCALFRWLFQGSGQEEGFALDSQAKVTGRRPRDGSAC